MKNLLKIAVIVLILASCKNVEKKQLDESPVEDQQTLHDSNVDNGDSVNYQEIGMKYATSTQKQLGKNLIAAIQEKGTLGAVKFCNIQAYPITDSMATVHHAVIKRVSDKPRNPNNKANAKELEHIAYFKSSIAEGKEYSPIVEEEGDVVKFYAPLITNAMCLQCHGKPNNDIQPEVMTSLQQLYPNDLATGYSANEVRGIWSITFEK